MYVAAVFLPLLGSLIAGLLGRSIGKRGAQAVTCGCMIVAGACGVLALKSVLDAHSASTTVRLFTWMASGSFEVAWSLRYDALSAVMVAMVTCVSASIHVYSVGYMAHDKSVPRFMAYLSLFTFFMLMLVTSNDLVQLFFGWEGVGLASYLLIGFWYERPSANAAAMKAFIVNRVGDFGFALGIFAAYLLFDAVNFDAIFAAVPQKLDAKFVFLGMEVHALTTIAILLFIGAMGKSAQLGLHTWLPDAMEGPTPVSALIHAATMVTAGVFLVCRMSPLFEHAPVALAVVTIVGASTAFFAATVGVTQTDIKRVIAYSTCSQLGYMFFAAGVSAYGAAIFHLVTHAFFKALLFLTAGSVIHAMSDEQDMRRMGGVWKHIKVTYAMMWIGSLALAGIPWFSGYWSKDMILEAAFSAGTGVGQYAFWLGIAAAFLTAFYSWRLIIMTFHGKPRADEHVMAHVHESPWIMLAPLLFLAAGAIGLGWATHDWFIGHHRAEFWGKALMVLPANDSIEKAHHHLPGWVVLLPLVIAVSGIALAYVCYMLRPGIPAATAARFRPLYLMSFRKWYFDELYDWLFVRPCMAIGRFLWKAGDLGTIDRFGPNGLAATAVALAKRASALQTGYVYHYAFVMLIGVLVFVTGYLVWRGL